MRLRSTCAFTLCFIKFKPDDVKTKTSSAVLRFDAFYRIIIFIIIHHNNRFVNSILHSVVRSGKFRARSNFPNRFNKRFLCGKGVLFDFSRKIADTRGVSVFSKLKNNVFKLVWCFENNVTAFFGYIRCENSFAAKGEPE